MKAVSTALPCITGSAYDVCGNRLADSHCSLRDFLSQLLLRDVVEITVFLSSLVLLWPRHAVSLPLGVKGWVLRYAARARLLTQTVSVNQGWWRLPR